MALMKRPASASATATVVAAKKPKTAPGMDKKAILIAEAIHMAEGIPERTKEMMCAGIVDAMKQPKDQRHPFQVKIIGWISEALSSVEASLKQQVADAESKVADANAEKERREAAVVTANEAAEKADTDAKEKQEVYVTAEVNLENANVALAEAEEAQKEGDAEISKTAAEKAELDDAFTNVFMKLKIGGVPEGEKGGLLAAASSTARTLSLDASMLTSLPSAFGKEPADRGTFDNLVVGQLDEEIKKRLGTFDETLQAAEPAKQERAAKVEEAKAKREAAATAAGDALSAKDAAVEAAAAAATAAKDAVKAVKSYASDMKEVAAVLATSQRELASLEKKALAAFKELEEYDGSGKTTWYQFIDGVKYEKLLLTIAADEPKPLTAESVEKLWESAQDAKVVTGCEKRTLEYILEQYEFVPEAKADLEAKMAGLPAQVIEE